MIRNTAAGYGLVAIVLHWAIAAAVFGQIALGLTMTRIESQRLRADPALQIDRLPAACTHGGAARLAACRPGATRGFPNVNESEIVFCSTSVRGRGDDAAIIEGNLTARGRTFRKTFTVTLAGFTATAIRFHITGKVRRSRYGMDVGTPIYSNVVDFDMDLLARRR